MRVQKFATHKRHNDFINEMIIQEMTSKKLLVCKKNDFGFKKDHWMYSINDSFYHTWASHCVVEVSKDSGIVHE